MAVKRFPQDFSDISSTATKILACNADNSNGFILQRSGGANLQDVTDKGAASTNTLILGSQALGRSFLSLSPSSSSPFNIQASVSGSGAGSLSINAAGGNVGFGRVNPTQVIDANGNILASGTITPGSDKRLKKSIKNLPNELETINKIRPVSYILKDGNAPSMGFIADEIRDFYPDLIIEADNEEKMLSMNYMGLTAPIVKAIQELSKQNELLLCRIEALEAKK